MPINGLSEKRRLPRIGKIKLGLPPGTDGKNYPKAVNYFVCDHPDFQKVYPGQPRALDIYLPTEDPEQFASQYYRLYGKRGLMCKGDGITCTRRVDNVTGEMASPDSTDVDWIELPCEGRSCDMYGNVEGGGCTEMMMLQIVLPLVPGLGVWQIDTGSINSIKNINNAVEMIRALHGRVSMIPLTLTVEKAEVLHLGQKRVVHVLNIRSKECLADMLKRQLPAAPTVSLPVPDDEIPHDIIPTNYPKDSIITTDKPLNKAEITKLENVGQLCQWAYDKYKMPLSKIVYTLKTAGILPTGEIRDLKDFEMAKEKITEVMGK